MLEEVMLYNKLVQDQYTEFWIYEHNGIDKVKISNGVPISQGGLFILKDFNTCPKTQLKGQLQHLRNYIDEDVMNG